MLVEQGVVGDAGRAAREAAALLGRVDRLGLRNVAVCLEALVAAAAGEPRRAAALLEDVPDTTTDLRLRIFGERARCWTAAAQGRLGDAAGDAVVAGRRAMAASASLYAADLLHDSIRFGSLAALPDLELLAARAEGELVATFAAHGRALHDTDPARLEVVSRRFETMGSPLFAAEAAAEAARAHRRAGSAARAARSTARSVLLAETCRARTPALLPALDLLTPREREIALLAAGRRTSNEIADRLGVTRKTVDNHLGAVYQKVGVGSRSELAAALAGDET